MVRNIIFCLREKAANNISEEMHFICMLEGIREGILLYFEVECNHTEGIKIGPCWKQLSCKLCIIVKGKKVDF